ncbi:MAG: cyclase family protein [Desulfamplus sp.]|nr:cyclase family protein [Desulfamplus sp.]
MDSIIDLSYPIYNGMSCYPGDPDVSIRQVRSIKKDRVNVTEISFGSHTGTHLDVPSHMLEHGKSLDKTDLSCFFGTAIKLHLNRYTEYDLSDFQYDGLILETGWGVHFNNPDLYFTNKRPSIPISLAQTLAETGIKFFGCDLPSVDQSGSRNKIIHCTFLEKNIVIYENLANLDKLPEGVPFTFIGFPLGIHGIDGSPVRAVGIIKKMLMIK